MLILAILIYPVGTQQEKRLNMIYIYIPSPNESIIGSHKNKVVLNPNCNPITYTGIHIPFHTNNTCN